MMSLQGEIAALRRQLENEADQRRTLVETQEEIQDGLADIRVRLDVLSETRSQGGPLDLNLPQAVIIGLLLYFGLTGRQDVLSLIMSWLGGGS